MSVFQLKARKVAGGGRRNEDIDIASLVRASHINARKRLASRLFEIGDTMLPGDEGEAIRKWLDFTQRGWERWVRDKNVRQKNWGRFRNEIMRGELMRLADDDCEYQRILSEMEIDSAFYDILDAGVGR